MLTFKVNMDATAAGTSLQDYVAAPYARLSALFGTATSSDDYKVSTEWIFEGEDGSVVTLYDYKATKLYGGEGPSVANFRAQPSYDWHVGAKDKATAAAFADWLRAQLAGTPSPAEAGVQASIEDAATAELTEAIVDAFHALAHGRAVGVLASAIVAADDDPMGKYETAFNALIGLLDDDIKGLNDGADGEADPVVLTLRDAQVLLRRALKAVQ